MKLFLFLSLAICFGIVLAQPQRNPCTIVNGKTYCTGLITPPPEQNNPCSTVNGKTYCTGLIVPPGQGGPGATRNRRFVQRSLEAIRVNPRLLAEKIRAMNPTTEIPMDRNGTRVCVSARKLNNYRI